MVHSCKDYLEAAEDEYILQHISMDKFPIVDWVPPGDESLAFLTLCFLKGNPEAIFRRGMMEYFSLTRVESGLDYLKRAAEKGHPEATYAYCMILLSKGEKSVLNLLNSRFRDWKIQDCRDKIRWVLSQIWINNRISLQQDYIFNCHHHGIGIGGFDRQVFSCQSCMWYQELRVFSRIVNGVA
ncbi:hypothetical protein L6452_21302 [Arctium lappa]|uniref:Uncharacterized protein n=1 Tax=Arctium lappa TaxID=4217 RepID=A0ACB9BF27_ARCLA|nr:hypothetical protein L6452_21302 [Arctium lappa]